MATLLRTNAKPPFSIRCSYWLSPGWSDQSQFISLSRWTWEYSDLLESTVTHCSRLVCVFLLISTWYFINLYFICGLLRFHYFIAMCKSDCSERFWQQLLQFIAFILHFEAVFLKTFNYNAVRRPLKRCQDVNFVVILAWYTKIHNLLMMVVNI